MSRDGLQGFRSERLQQILRVRRLTQLQLANLVNVSTPSVSNWCKGKQFPNRETVEKLAQVLNVQPELFLAEYESGIGHVCFRSDAAALKRGRDMLYGRLEWGEEVAERLEEFLDFPDVNLPDFRFKSPEEITDEDIEEAARQCRKLWKLGKSPIQDLALAAEGAGIILIREVTGIPNIEGLSGWSMRLNRPLVLLSADKENGYRSRFDLAHEIGHLCLHRHVPKELHAQFHSLMEKQVHKFAGALLLPAESIAKETSIYPTWDELLLLKKKWGVSAAAILMRLLALEIVSEERTREMFQRRSARWGRRAEPGDDCLPPEKPRLLRRSVEMLVKENIMPLSGLLRHLQLSTCDLENLLGLPEGYFSSQHEAANIVELATLKRFPSKSKTNASTETNVIKFSR
ncbi:XRE family transcriptional regulator [Acetobacteraceae bacterium ESL0709]|nr:XRE family transcriptional regulator [Acetobacteraceae bacterium ESL0697]MDF7677379.1 XRE family transcriptional regulator [Acetobacteraceae bacterium ESL0709]